MNKKKCEVCGSTHTVKNGVRKGVQLYKCQDCGHQFRAGNGVNEDELWDAYQQEKQTIKELNFYLTVRPMELWCYLRTKCLPSLNPNRSLGFLGAVW